jgi:hypothetical protein
MSAGSVREIAEMKTLSIIASVIRNCARLLNRSRVVVVLGMFIFSGLPMRGTSPTFVDSNEAEIGDYLENLLQSLTGDEKDIIIQAELRRSLLHYESALGSLVQPLVEKYQLDIDARDLFRAYLVSEFKRMVLQSRMDRAAHERMWDRINGISIDLRWSGQEPIVDLLNGLSDFAALEIAFVASGNFNLRPAAGGRLTGMPGGRALELVTKDYGCAFLLRPPNKIVLTDFQELRTIRERLESYLQELEQKVRFSFGIRNTSGAELQRFRIGDGTSFELVGDVPSYDRLFRGIRVNQDPASSIEVRFITPDGRERAFRFRNPLPPEVFDGYSPTGRILVLEIDNDFSNLGVAVGDAEAGDWLVFERISVSALGLNTTR